MPMQAAAGFEDFLAKSLLEFPTLSADMLAASSQLASPSAVLTLSRAAQQAFTASAPCREAFLTAASIKWSQNACRTLEVDVIGWCKLWTWLMPLAVEHVPCADLSSSQWSQTSQPGGHASIAQWPVHLVQQIHDIVVEDTGPEKAGGSRLGSKAEHNAMAKLLLQLLTLCRDLVRGGYLWNTWPPHRTSPLAPLPTSLYSPRHGMLYVLQIVLRPGDTVCAIRRVGAAVDSFLIKKVLRLLP